jgi:hypothetical protein
MTTAELFYRFGFPKNYRADRSTAWVVQKITRSDRDVIQSNVPADNDVKYPMLLPLYSTMGLLCSRTADARLTPSRGVA